MVLINCKLFVNISTQLQYFIFQRPNACFFNCLKFTLWLAGLLWQASYISQSGRLGRSLVVAAALEFSWPVALTVWGSCVQTALRWHWREIIIGFLSSNVKRGNWVIRFHCVASMQVFTVHWKISLGTALLLLPEKKQYQTNAQFF